MRVMTFILYHVVINQSFATITCQYKEQGTLLSIKEVFYASAHLHNDTAILNIVIDTRYDTIRFGEGVQEFIEASEKEKQGSIISTFFSNPLERILYSRKAASAVKRCQGVVKKPLRHYYSKKLYMLSTPRLVSYCFDARQSNTVYIQSAGPYIASPV